MADKQFSQKHNLIFNNIPGQVLTYSNQLTIKAWNDTINILRVQTNTTVDYLKKLHTWLVGDGESFINYSGANSFFGYIENTHITLNSKIAETKNEIKNEIKNVLNNKEEVCFDTYSEIGLGTPGGVATLNENGKLLNSQIPDNIFNIRLKVGMNLKGHTIYFNTEHVLKNEDFVENDRAYYGININEYENYYIRYDKDNLSLTLRQTTYHGDSKIIDTFALNGEWLKSEYTFDEYDYYIDEIYNEDIFEKNLIIATSINYIEKDEFENFKNQAEIIISKKADLVDGKVPAEQLPSYVDDVLEYTSQTSFPATGEKGKIYIDKAQNMTYRWSGSQYIAIGTQLDLTNGTGTNSVQQLNSTAKGKNSFAEGQNTSANGLASHTEGYKTTVSSAREDGSDTTGAHAEGHSTDARGTASHAEGYGSVARGNISHAGGRYTIANGDSQTTIGKYNIEDEESLFIVGNGDKNTRSNAFRVLPDGRVQAYGTPTQKNDLTTKEYVDANYIKSVYIKDNKLWVYKGNGSGVGTKLPEGSGGAFKLYRHFIELLDDDMYSYYYFIVYSTTPTAFTTPQEIGITTESQPIVLYDSVSTASIEYTICGAIAFSTDVYFYINGAERNWDETYGADPDDPNDLGYPVWSISDMVSELN